MSPSPQRRSLPLPLPLPLVPESTPGSARQHLTQSGRLSILLADDCSEVHRRSLALAVGARSHPAPDLSPVPVPLFRSVRVGLRLRDHVRRAAVADVPPHPL